MKKIFIIIFVFFGYIFTNAQPCTIIDATNCQCLDDSQTDCDLLPDIDASWYGLENQSGNGYGPGPTEYPQTGAGANNGRLRIDVSTTNIGVGPLTVRGIDDNGYRWFLCDGDTFSIYDPNSSIEYYCPSGSEAKQITFQRIYHKNSDGSMSYYDRIAGTMTYHPTHGHNHSDDWGVFTLRIEDPNEPDPRNWPIVSDGAKMGFCLMDYGTCGDNTNSTYWGHCRDDNTQYGGGNVLLNSDFPNFGLGGGSYGCSMTEQGISSGWLDLYGAWLDDQWIDIDPSLCNGDYWIVGIIDQNNNYLESNENNNYTAIPFSLTQQGNSSISTIDVSGEISLCQGEDIQLTANYGNSYLWSTGDTTQTININQPGSYSVTVENANCPGSSPSDSTTISFIDSPNPPIVNYTPNPAYIGDDVVFYSDTESTKWYDENNNLLFMGDTLYIDSLDENFILYATQNDVLTESDNTGMLNHQGSDYSGSEYNSFLIFNALQDFTLNSVEIFTDSIGERTIELRNTADQVLKDTTIYISSDMVVNLMWDIPQGNDYRLGTNNQTNNISFQTDNPWLKRSSEGSSYPYVINNVVEITSTEYGTDWYYYFYNWDVSWAVSNCDSEPILIEVETLIGLEELVSTNFTIHPNPTNGVFFLNFNLEKKQNVLISITDLSGRSVYRKNLNNMLGNVSIDANLNKISNGTYYVSIVTDESLETQKLILQR